MGFFFIEIDELSCVTYIILRVLNSMVIFFGYEFRMSSQQYLSGDLLSYTNGAFKFSVKFCVVKFSSFG